MFAVGCDSNRSFAGCHGKSSIQCCVLNCFFALASLRTFETLAIISFSSALNGRGCGLLSILIGLTSSLRGVVKARINRHDGLSSTALSAEGTSFGGRRPHLGPYRP